MNRPEKDIRVIVCDLDGTLLNSGKRISEKNLKAIKAARAKGVFTTICSGRVPAMLEAYSKEICIEIPLIAANGGVIYDTLAARQMYTENISAKVIEQVLDFFKDYDYGVLGSSGYFSKASKRIKRFIHYNEIAKSKGLKEYPLYYIDELNYNQMLSMDIFKVLVSTISYEDTKKAKDFLDNQTNLTYTSSDRGLLDISAYGVSKGSGLSRLISIMGLSKENVCVMGDYFNDISMFKAAGFSIAMANAHPDVKSQASSVTDSNDNGGVAAAIEKYIL